MSNIPTPIRAALGLAATAVDEARKLPATLPQAVSTVPMAAISTAMQASFRLQQRIAALTVRGDEVISQLRGTSSEPPSWAKFDEPVTGTEASADGASATPGSADDRSGAGREIPPDTAPARPDTAPARPDTAPARPRAAFDRIDYGGTGFDDGDDEPGRWDAVGVGGTEPDAEETPGSKAVPAKKAPAKKAPAKKAAAGKAPAKKAAAGKASAKQPTAAQQSEPIEQAAKRAKPADKPNPATMAAEIVQAHEAEQSAEHPEASAENTAEHRTAHEAE